MKLPDPLARRHLLEGETPEARCLEIAEAYRAEGRDVEAIGFLEKAGATEALEGLVQQAIAAGDAFLAQASARALGRELEKGEWTALGEAAAAGGKERYQEVAVRQSGA